MVGFLLGLQGSYTKFPCFLCLWDNRAGTEDWIKKDWPMRSELISGSLNVLTPPLVESSKIVFPALHIKLSIMKQFVKAFEKDGDCFKYRGDRVWLSSVLVVTFNFLSIWQPCAIITLMLNHVSLPLCLPDVL